MNILLTSRLLHDEASEHFYENQTLLVRIRYSGRKRPCVQSTNHGRLAPMNPRTCKFFKRLEITVEVYPKPYPLNREGVFVCPQDAIVELLSMLPNVETVVFSFNNSFTRAWQDRVPENDQIVDALHWLIDRIPSSIELRWDFTYWSEERLGGVLKEKLARRGSLHTCKSVTREGRGR